MKLNKMYTKKIYVGSVLCFDIDGWLYIPCNDEEHITANEINEIMGGRR